MISEIDRHSFIVYVDEPTRKINIHRTGCGMVAMHGGVSKGTRPTSWYIGFFKEMKGATHRAEATGLSFPVAIHDCHVEPETDPVIRTRGRR